MAGKVKFVLQKATHILLLYQNRDKITMKQLLHLRLAGFLLEYVSENYIQSISKEDILAYKKRSNKKLT